MPLFCYKATLNICLILICLTSIESASDRLFYVPLDERFTTRVAFLNLAKLTTYDILPMPQQYLPSLKKYAKPDDILDWALSQMQSTNGIVSLETILYGSLIGSRISNDTLETVKKRIDRLVDLRRSHPELKLYGSAVVMRIPDYNGDFEQPWFWASHGHLLFVYSYYYDKYTKTHDPSDLDQSNKAKDQIPMPILQEFQWRRNRNHQALIYLLNALSRNPWIFQKLFITLDDNALYGFNIEQANQIKQMVSKAGLTERVLVYPGADEVSLCLLAAFTVSDNKIKSPIISMIFRNQSTADRVPNYQGMPMIDTIIKQITAAGGTAINGSAAQPGNITLLINNFSQDKQKQAPYQSDSQKVSYQTFDNFICNQTKSNIVGLVDNRFSNGADIEFVNYVLERIVSCSRSSTGWAYAGWNTNGNTVGTVIANSVLLWVRKVSNFRNQWPKSFKSLNFLNPLKSLKSFKSFNPLNSLKYPQQKYCNQCSPCSNLDASCANLYFNSLRILEDRDWQSILRSKLISYIQQVPGDSFNSLSTDLAFYQKYTFKSLASKFEELRLKLSCPFTLTGIYYPWNRTFEIGITGELKNSLPSTF